MKITWLLHHQFHAGRTRVMLLDQQITPCDRAQCNKYAEVRLGHYKFLCMEHFASGNRRAFNAMNFSILKGERP